jgi:TolB protein
LTSTGDNEDPSWSPDGLHIAFSSTRGGGSDIYTMDWDGGNIRQVTRGGGYVSPSWSPKLGSR